MLDIAQYCLWQNPVHNVQSSKSMQQSGKLQASHMDERKFQSDLTVGSMPRQLLSFSIPMLMANMLQSGYSIINMIRVGNIVGENGLEATAVSFPIMFIRHDPVLDMGVPHLSIIAPCFLLYAQMFVSNGIVSGAGDHGNADVFAVFALGGTGSACRVSIPTFFLRHDRHLDSDGSRFCCYFRR
jgi:Na+-driven multidrug efflux pump